MRQSRKKWERRREVHRNKLAAMIFVIMMIAFCVVNLATGDREFSATENRALEQRPELTISGIESGRWMEQYESYVSDQFAGRDFWVMLKSRVDLLAGKRKANGVFKGKDHYLLEDIAKPDEDQMKENLSAMKMFQKQYKDIPMYMMLVPNAANIESDKLPGYAVTENQEKQFKAIHSTLESVYTWVDVSDILKVSEGRWQIEECFRIMKTDFSARPVYLQDENRIKAHFLICFLALTLYRYLEKKMNLQYTCEELLDTLKAMNFAEIQEQGFIPLYKREKITDDLHEACGFRTDYQFITKRKMKEIQKKSKRR